MEGVFGKAPLKNPTMEVDVRPDRRKYVSYLMAYKFYH